MKHRDKHTFARSVKIEIDGDYEVVGTVKGTDIRVVRVFPDKAAIRALYDTDRDAASRAYREAGKRLEPIVLAECRRLWDARRSR